MQGYCCDGMEKFIIKMGGDRSATEGFEICPCCGSAEMFPPLYEQEHDSGRLCPECGEKREVVKQSAPHGETIYRCPNCQPESHRYCDECHTVPIVLKGTKVEYCHCSIRQPCPTCKEGWLELSTERMEWRCLECGAGRGISHDEAIYALRIIVMRKESPGKAGLRQRERSVEVMRWAGILENLSFTADCLRRIAEEIMKIRGVK